MWFGVLVSDVHRRLSDFIHAIVVHRRREAKRVAELDWFILISGLGLIWFTQLHVSSVSSISRLVVLVCLLIRLG